MSSNKIIEKAIYSFSINGYAGTSISNIAELVGIKKSTIYSHFKSKDEIFERATEVSFKAETDFAVDYFSKKEEPILDVLEGFLVSLKERFVNDEDFTINFVYKIGYRLVERYNDFIKKYCDDYYFTVEKLIIEYLIREGIEKNLAKEIAMTYTALLDGLMVSLMYCGEDRYEERKEAVWKFFSESFLKSCK
ncbi:MAG: TetR/AcrR family transcriptional regulator [Intestinibacter sp.]|uniref:TetR/AcrR family transcriptional regulator n=1 Tax=Intestinibacter sp. TaxID=1965304 RepID=UPI003F14C8C2